MIFLTLAKTIKTSSDHNGNSKETIHDLLIWQKSLSWLKRNYFYMAWDIYKMT